MKKYLLLLIFFLVHVSSFYSQKSSVKKTKQSFKEVNKLAQFYLEKQSLDTALIYAQKALTLSELEFGKDTSYCNSLSTIFYIYYSQNNFKEALNYCTQEKDLRKTLKGSDHPEYATSLDNLGSIYYSTGKYNDAEKYMSEAVTIIKNAFGEKNTIYGNLINNLATVYRAQANYIAAEPLYKQGSQIKKETAGEKSAEYAFSLFYLGGLYNDMGNYKKAEDLYLATLKIQKETIGENNTDYALTLGELGFLYKTIGNYSAAEYYYTSALKIQKEIFGEKSPDYSISLNNLAALFVTVGNYAAAEKTMTQALDIQKELFGEKNPTYATTLSNLAQLYQTIGNYSVSETLTIKALNIKKETIGVKHPDYAKSLNNLALLYSSIHNYKYSEALLLEALTIRKEIFGTKHPEYLFYISSLANFYDLTGKYDTAQVIFLNCMSSIKESVTRNFSFLSEKEKELYFKTQSPYFSRFFAFALKHKTENTSITKEAYNTVITNKGLLLKSSTAMRSVVLGSKDTLLVFQYNKWIELKKEISKLNSTEISKRKKDPEVLEKQANEIEKELVKTSSELNELKKLQDLTWLDVQKNLKKNEAAIEFLHFTLSKKNDTTIYCALIITPESKYPEMIKIFDEKDLIKILGAKSETNESYISGIYGKRSVTNSKLYDLIWKPLENSLKNTKTIYYSPSGLLHKISFAALSKNKNSYLCDNHRLELQGSTAKLASPEKFDLNSGSVVSVFGDINYDTPETLKDTTALVSWPYLEGTKTESEKITSILKTNNFKYEYVAEKNATELAFKTSAQQNNILHIATHGFFFPDPDAYSYSEKQDSTKSETRAYRGGDRAIGINNFVTNKNPLMRSGLVFAGANEVWVREESNDKDDGVLTAQEVANLDLRKTHLVVLSACETGLGDIKGTEGVYGLQRSLKMAGVKNIIMSLWQVPDAETVEFMDKFYTKLTKTKDIKTSFYETRNEMRQKYDPFYWAAFVLLE